MQDLQGAHQRLALLFCLRLTSAKSKNRTLTALSIRIPEKSVLPGEEL
jgi:hypothetical protein